MIFEANQSDGQQIPSVAVATGVFTPLEIERLRELWDDHVRLGASSPFVFLVFRDQDQVEGFACYAPRPITEGTFDLYWMAVEPAAHRRGIGRSLVQAVEQQVLAQNGRLLLIETSSTRPYAPARRFYEDLGYRYTAVIHDFYKPGDDLIVFGKASNALSSAGLGQELLDSS